MSEKDYTYIFVGKVIPEFTAQGNSFNVKITGVHFIFKDEKEAVASEVNIKLKNSLLICECKFDKEVVNPPNLMSTLKTYLHSLTDALGYEQGRAYDIDVITCFDSQNKPFNFWDESLKGLCSSEKRPYKSLEIVTNLYGNFEFSETMKLCYANIREAIRFPNDTPFFCYRAAENIRQYFVKKHNISDPDKSWGKMWKSLNYNDKKYFTDLSKISAKVRHGDIIAMSIIERSEMLEKTYVVIDKFTEYAINEIKI